MQPSQDKEEKRRVLGTDPARWTKIKRENVTRQENKAEFCSENRKRIHPSLNFKHTHGKGHPGSSSECFKSAGNLGCFGKGPWAVWRRGFLSFPAENLASSYKSNPSQQGCSLHPLLPALKLLSSFLNEFKCCWRGKYLFSESTKFTLKMSDVDKEFCLVKGAPKLRVRTAMSWILGGQGT